MVSDWAIVALTAALVIITGYYAWQNKRMADHNARIVDEMRRQNRPYVFIACEHRRLVLRNGGNRSAHSVRISSERDCFMTDIHPVVKDGYEEPANTTISFQWLEACHQGVRCVLPGAAIELAHVLALAGLNRIEYRIGYTDGAGLAYEEDLAIDL